MSSCSLIKHSSGVVFLPVNVKMCKALQVDKCFFIVFCSAFEKMQLLFCNVL